MHVIYSFPLECLAELAEMFIKNKPKHYFGIYSGGILNEVLFQQDFKSYNGIDLSKYHKHDLIAHIAIVESSYLS